MSAWQAKPVTFCEATIITSDEGVCSYKMQGKSGEWGNTIGLLAKKVADEAGISYEKAFKDICQLNELPHDKPNDAAFSKIKIGQEITLPSYEFLSAYASSNFTPDAGDGIREDMLANPTGVSTTQFASNATNARSGTYETDNGDYSGGRTGSFGDEIRYKRRDSKPNDGQKGSGEIVADNIEIGDSSHPDHDIGSVGSKPTHDDDHTLDGNVVSHDSGRVAYNGTIEWASDDPNADHNHMHIEDFNDLGSGVLNKDWCEENLAKLYNDDYPKLVKETVKLIEQAEKELVTISEKTNTPLDSLRGLTVDDLMLYTNKEYIPAIAALGELENAFNYGHANPLDYKHVLKIAQGKTTFKEAMIDQWGEDEYYALIREDYNVENMIAMELFEDHPNAFSDYASRQALNAASDLKHNESRLKSRVSNATALTEAKQRGDYLAVVALFKENALPLSEGEKLILKAQMKVVTDYQESLEDGKIVDPLELAELLISADVDDEFVAYLSTYARDNREQYLATHKEDRAERRKQYAQLGLDPDEPTTILAMGLGTEQLQALASAQNSEPKNTSVASRSSDKPGDKS